MNDKLNALLEQLSSVIFGKEKECRLAVCALLAGGDLLVDRTYSTKGVLS